MGNLLEQVDLGRSNPGFMRDVRMASGIPILASWSVSLVEAVSWDAFLSLQGIEIKRRMLSERMHFQT
ncbi:hypothetical protein ATO67_20790 [Agrobacterium bohemicum]|uniref:Uncharacterized protein n=1 Tax=Agrobacterium bohemicum TaxID=2052828 RepID=A0A135P6Z3_9HYPH|nr:hypothetical protein ATO67_20790 [Agrobacterium bohemicum]